MTQGKSISGTFNAASNGGYPPTRPATPAGPKSAVPERGPSRPGHGSLQNAGTSVPDISVVIPNDEGQSRILVCGTAPGGDPIHEVRGLLFFLGNQRHVYPDGLTAAYKAAETGNERQGAITVRTCLPLELLEAARKYSRAIAFPNLTVIAIDAHTGVKANDPRPADMLPGTKAYRDKLCGRESEPK